MLQVIDGASIFVDLGTYFSNKLIKLKDHIYNRINNLTENEIKETERDDIEKIANILRNLMSKIVPKSTPNLIYEEINLNYHYKCFISKNFEKRLKGITYISKEIENCSYNRSQK